MSSARPPERSARAARLPVRELVLLGVGALAVRLLYIFVIARAPVGIGGDAGFYESAARLLAHGTFYARTIFNHSYQTAEHPPLYPLVLAMLSPLSGAGETGFRIVSCVIGSLGVALIALLAARLGGRRAGRLAGALAAFYPPFVTADGLIMSEPLFVVTVAAALLLALHVRVRPSLPVAVWLGVAVGAATLTRGEGLLLIPLLALPALCRRAPSGRGVRVLAAMLASLAVIAPWVVRNAIVFHRLILATDSNTLIAGANCHDTYYGHDIGWWSMRCLKRARTRRQLSTGDAHTSTALRYAGRHLGRLPLVAAVRVLRTFNLFQPLRQGNQEPRRKWVDVIGLVFYFPLLLLAGFGLRRLRAADRGGTLVLLLAPVWMVIASSALGWGIGRFRIAADITIVVLATLAVTGVRSRSTGR
jgi:4-amino-4-deoxy-L-arabinose transferase-like glycosyltransferase